MNQEQETKAYGLQIIAKFKLMNKILLSDTISLLSWFRKWFLSLVLLFCLVSYSEACRFTVREIGFSTLSRSNYILAVLDKGGVSTDSFWKDVNYRLQNSNIKLEFLNSSKDKDDPVFLEIKNRYPHVPRYVIVSPKGTMLDLSDMEPGVMINQLLHSSITDQLSDNFPDVFCILLWIEGVSEYSNLKADSIISSNCESIENVMPHMPKEVGRGPLAIRITAHNFNSERILLWSLGIMEKPKQPVAFVLYGRGSVMGERVGYKRICNNRLYDLMGMIGLDCECGLDRRWMLGSQIPMLWSAKNRQKLASEVGFDVDNPMILSEMSRIMAQKTVGEQASQGSFEPQIIDMERELGVDEKEQIPQKTDSFYLPLLIVVGGFVVLVLLIGVFVYYRNSR